jgi:CheY-like chemotaxis protein
LVDDDKDILYTLFDIYLKSIGDTTVSFVNPVEALNYFNKDFTNFILVITEYEMPQMSRLDLIKEDKKTNRNYRIKLIVISTTIKNNIINYNDKLFNLKIDHF